MLEVVTSLIVVVPAADVVVAIKLEVVARAEEVSDVV